MLKQSIDQWGRTVREPPVSRQVPGRPPVMPQAAVEALEELRRHPQPLNPKDLSRIDWENTFA